MSYPKQYLDEVKKIADSINLETIDQIISILNNTKSMKGRIFFIGVGGSAANCSHAVNDFRKIAGIESYAPTDNVAELTARTNDEGWDTTFAAFLKTSNLNQNDTVFVLSVGGGNKEKNISANIVKALEFAKERNSKIVGIVSRDGGYTAQIGDAVIIIPVLDPNNTTPHAESWQGVVWHMLVTDPRLKASEGKWESIDK